MNLTKKDYVYCTIIGVLCGFSTSIYEKSREQEVRIKNLESCAAAQVELLKGCVNTLELHKSEISDVNSGLYVHTRTLITMDRLFDLYDRRLAIHRQGISDLTSTISAITTRR